MMLFTIACGFLVALIAPLLHRLLSHRVGWLLALLPVSLFLYLTSFIEQIQNGAVKTFSYLWVSSLNVDLNFVVDGLSLLMGLIVTGIGALIFIYAAGYLKDDEHLGRFYSFLLIFMAAMLGLVLSDNLLGVFIFWELTSISSYLLIGYKHRYEESRKAALTALIVTGSGSLAMLAGFILLGMIGGQWDISQLDNQHDLIRAHSLYLPILVLVAFGAFTKSAQFPFHFWLPGAMAAPTPVSAYLHSATMVKAGVFLLARLNPVLGSTDEWRMLITSFGLATMLIGGFLSIRQTDLKRILAYSTVSSLGLMVMLLGWGTKVAIEAMMLFLLVHSLYKGALFLVAGTIDHETGTRDIEQLGGLARAMPFLGFGAVLAALSMSGIPPLIGFIGKELIYEATLAYESGKTFGLDLPNLALTITAVIGNMAAITVACLVVIVPFWGHQKETPLRPHAPSITLWLGPTILGVLSLLFGLVPSLVDETLIAPASTAVYHQQVQIHLSLWHGITPMLILSIITVVGGATFFLQRKKLQSFLDRLDVGAQYSVERGFGTGIDQLPHIATRITRVFQSGYLRYYVATIIGTTVLLAGYPLLNRVGLPTLPSQIDALIYELIIAGAILSGVFMVLTSKRLLFTVAALGVIGYGSALIFVLYGAPDLAMTQFAIETLSVVLFVLVLYRLPNLAHLSSRRSRIRDALVASAAGGIVTILVLVISSIPLDSKLTSFFATSSYAEAKGRNIVNVILVDFRGFDTLGEITVLAVAAIGVFALLKLRISSESVSENQSPDRHGEHEP